MSKWREDAQPEWPEIASGGRDQVVTGGNTQTFPETGPTGVLGDAKRDDKRDDKIAVSRPTEAGRIPAQPDGRRSSPSAPKTRTAPFRDPWQEPGTPEEAHTHDPNEVTVQLDAIQLGNAGLETAPSGPGGRRDGGDGPVFVDESGRRNRTFRRIGIFVALACATYAVVIVATLLSGNSSAPWLPVPGQEEDKPAGQVDSSPLETPSASSAPTVTGPPAATVSASQGAATAPGTGSLPRPSGSAATKPSTSADPKPSASTSVKPSSQSTTGEPDPEVSHPVVSSPDPSASTATSEPPDSSPSPNGGAGPVAQGSPDPVPASPDAAGPTPSPENVL